MIIAYCVVVVGTLLASNPIVKSPTCTATGGAGGMCGVADPNLKFFDGKFLLFATHDFSINNTGFRMDNWQVWSSSDLVAWTLESTVRPQDSLKWDTQLTECWATDAAYSNGAYYFYVSAGGSEVGVMTATSPKGPWSDPLGAPLLSNALGKSLGTTFRDPCVFQEPGTDDFYLIAGVFTYYITKLRKDLISLAEKPKLVKFIGPDVYGPCGGNKTDDKPFLHKHNVTYYLSWGCFYATSSSVYGPFTMQGAVIDTKKIATEFQCDGQPHQCGAAAAARRQLPANGKSKMMMTATQRARSEALAQYKSAPAPAPWYLAEDLSDRHGSFLEHAKQWYYLSNDRSHSGDVGHEDVFRDTVGCYIHFRANNTMESCVINAQGVNQHSLTEKRVIEAEEFFSLSGDDAKKVDLEEALQIRGEGFAVGGGHDTTIVYPHVTGFTDTAARAFTLRIATSGVGALIEIRLNATSSLPHDVGDDDVLLLASCALPATGGLTVFADVPCAFESSTLSTEDALKWEAEVTMRVVAVAAGARMRLDRFWQA